MSRIHPLLAALLLSALALTACIPAPEARQDSIIMLEAANERELSRDQLAAAVRGHDIVLAGETHDNPWHHQAQADIVRWAAADGRPVTVVFEMLDRSQQEGIDRFTESSGTAADFPGAVSWEERGWPPPALYQPLFDAAFEIGAEITAGNISQESVREVSQAGLRAAPEALVKRFALDDPPPAEELEEMREIQFQGHCELIPREALDGMVLVQRLRDAALASAILEAKSARPAARVVLIAGRGHVRKDHAVAALLGAAAPSSSVLTVGLGEREAEEAPSLGPGLSELYDILWVWPAAEREDPCEALKAYFKG